VEPELTDGASDAARDAGVWKFGEPEVTDRKFGEPEFTGGGESNKVSINASYESRRGGGEAASDAARDAALEDAELGVAASDAALEDAALEDAERKFGEPEFTERGVGVRKSGEPESTGEADELRKFGEPEFTGESTGVLSTLLLYRCSNKSF
tara:strand:- start:115 stop:573 length:459 start_codon:yes stop_codon:yes gene_type:complete